MKKTKIDPIVRSVSVSRKVSGVFLTLEKGKIEFCDAYFGGSPFWCVKVDTLLGLLRQLNVLPKPKTKQPKK